MHAVINHITLVLGSAIFFAAIYIGALAYHDRKNRMPVKPDYKKQFGLK